MSTDPSLCLPDISEDMSAANEADTMRESGNNIFDETAASTKINETSIPHNNTYDGLNEPTASLILKKTTRAGGRWKPNEDHLLLTKMQEYGRKWERIAKELPGRNAQACKNRFRYIKPKLNNAIKSALPESSMDT